MGPIPLLSPKDLESLSSGREPATGISCPLTDRRVTTLDLALGVSTKLLYVELGKTKYWDGPSLGGLTTSQCNNQPRPTQSPTLSGMRNEYQPKCGDALRLGRKGRMAHCIRG